MTHLALHVYFWGDAELTRLLTDCLGPATRALQDRGLLQRFWFTIFDTRGPHVIAVLTSPEDGADEVRRRIGQTLDRYLAEYPSTVRLPAEELERRHAECRGKQLSTIDTQPGIAPNNSYRMATHSSDAYPFNRGAGVAAQDELWRLAQDVAFWAIDQRRARTSTAGAVRWIGWMDQALASAGANPEEFWRYHAQTLLIPLEARLRQDEPDVLACLPGAVSERNRATFDRLWNESPPPPQVEAMVDIVLAEDGRTAERKRMLLREINHCTLAQLGQPVLHHIPLILYAWQRNLQLQPE